MHDSNSCLRPPDATCAWLWSIGPGDSGRGFRASLVAPNLLMTHPASGIPPCLPFSNCSSSLLSYSDWLSSPFHGLSDGLSFTPLCLSDGSFFLAVLPLRVSWSWKDEGFYHMLFYADLVPPSCQGVSFGCGPRYPGISSPQLFQDRAARTSPHQHHTFNFYFMPLPSVGRISRKHLPQAVLADKLWYKYLGCQLVLVCYSQHVKCKYFYFVWNNWQNVWIQVSYTHYP